jgi:enoyl-CoA hydratase/carnithine racemase
LVTEKYASVRVDVANGTGRVILARPDRANAVDPAAAAELGAAIDDLAADPAVRVIVVTADGPNFCAGGDLDFLRSLPEMTIGDVHATVYKHFQGAIRRIFNCSKPTIAAVRGNALTFGCELALACDFRVAGPSARFQESWVRMGLVPPLGGMYLLPRLIGLSKATEYIVLGRPIEAAAALALGLVLEVVPDDMLDDAAERLSQELQRLPPLAVAAARAGLRQGLGSTLEREWEAAVHVQAALLKSDDLQEAVAAITARRAPSFGGR